jgi:hypothetical protein
MLIEAPTTAADRDDADGIKFFVGTINVSFDEANRGFGESWKCLLSVQAEQAIQEIFIQMSTHV